MASLLLPLIQQDIHDMKISLISVWVDKKTQLAIT